VHRLLKQQSSGLSVPTSLQDGHPTYQPEHYMGEALMDDARSGDALGKLCRYEAALMNGANRTLQQLVVLQDRRARENGEDQIVEVLTSEAESDAG
jgi:hypothetical protein